jgi:hypothetical protein
MQKRNNKPKITNNELKRTKHINYGEFDPGSG